MFTNFTLNSWVNKDLSPSLYWESITLTKSLFFTKCPRNVALLSASRLFHLNFLATDGRCNSIEYFSNKSLQNFSALTKSVLTYVCCLSLHMPKKQFYGYLSILQTKWSVTFTSCSIMADWTCFFTVGKSKLQIII